MKEPPLLLVADDDDLLRTIVEHKLSSRGWRVLVAADGIEALRLVRERSPQVVVLDAMMPGPDGFEVLRRLKEDPATAGIPVIMLTSRKLEDDIVRALELGASDYLVKPFIPGELALRVQRLARGGS